MATAQVVVGRRLNLNRGCPCCGNEETGPNRWVVVEILCIQVVATGTLSAVLSRLIKLNAASSLPARRLQYS